MSSKQRRHRYGKQTKWDPSAPIELYRKKRKDTKRKRTMKSKTFKQKFITLWANNHDDSKTAIVRDCELDQSYLLRDKDKSIRARPFGELYFHPITYHQPSRFVPKEEEEEEENDVYHFKQKEKEKKKSKKKKRFQRGGIKTAFALFLTKRKNKSIRLKLNGNILDDQETVIVTNKDEIRIQFRKQKKKDRIYELNWKETDHALWYQQEDGEETQV